MKEEHHSEPVGKNYPVGRGYGHDYMRGGEVFGGYGYSEREEYEMPRGSLPESTGASTESESMEQEA
jgi:hypothetical protein